MSLSSSFLLLVVVGASSAQVIRPGKCPDIPVKRNFVMGKYLGTWYEQERFPALFEFGQKCVKANYGLMDDGNVKITNSGIDVWSGEPSTAIGEAKVPDMKTPAKLKVRFSRWSSAGDYWVIATDYKGFSLVFSCNDYWMVHTEFAWVLTRQRGRISRKSMKKIQKIFRTYGIDTSSFSKTEQTNCG